MQLDIKTGDTGNCSKKLIIIYRTWQNLAPLKFSWFSLTCAGLLERQNYYHLFQGLHISLTNSFQVPSQISIWVPTP